MTVPPSALNQDHIRAQLRRVPEPCGLLMREPVDICEMGLVDEITITDGQVRVELVLTDPSCVHFNGLRRYITDVLLELPAVDAVQVTISTTTLWTPDRQTGRAARQSPVDSPALRTRHSLPDLRPLPPGVSLTPACHTFPARCCRGIGPHKGANRGRMVR